MGVIVRFNDGSEPMNCTVVSDRDGQAVVSVDGVLMELTIQATGEHRYRVLSTESEYRVHGLPQSDGFELLEGPISIQATVQDERDSWLGSGGGAGASGAIKSQMPGKVVSLFVELGQAVSAGERLLSIEAMKMENEVVSPCDGVVQSIHVECGVRVEAGEKLIVIGASSDE